MCGYTPMIRQYLQIKADYPDCFLFFRLGDFYELFFDDARRASQELEITLTSRDGGKKERIPMCGVPYHSADSYIARLIARGFKVAICEQTENPAQAKGVVRREVVRVVTPGTVLGDQMLEEKQNNYLVAVDERRNMYGLAAADVSTGEVAYTELESLRALLDEVAAYAPAEIVTSSEFATDDAEQLQSHFSAPLTVLAADELTSEGAGALLNAQFPTQSEQLSDDPLAYATVACLLHYLHKTQKRGFSHLQSVHRYETDAFMALDQFARRNLELTATIRDGKRYGSLLWLLDHTATAMGGRLLKKWLDKPLLSVQAIEERLTAVQVFVDDMLLTEDVRDILKNVYDLERLAGRIAYDTANGRDLSALKRSLEQLPALANTLKRAAPSFYAALGVPDLCQDVQQKIAAALVDDPPVSVKEGGLIREGYRAELDRLLTAKRDGKAWLTRLEQEERAATGIKSLKVGYNRVFGYYLEVTKANLHLLPEGRYVRKQTLANAERFITPELKEKEALILEAEERAVEVEYDLFIQLREAVGTEIERLQTLAQWVATLDVWQSLATVSAKNDYVRPEIAPSGPLQIKEGRHPVVEQMIASGDFTANDTTLDAAAEQVLLITGPNMAGKSTYMRQVALIAIMAHIGCFVPASAARIPLVDRIFTRIGAADDLVSGQSTFMVEMVETEQALTQATARSLILLDEIGRGTSTYDGMAIAHAIVEYIHDRVGAMTLFSTHYHELTQLADELPRVRNVHARCEERGGELLFLHRIEPGRADRSYGVHVAELSGLPDALIARAREVLEELERGRYGGGTTRGQLSFAWPEPETERRTEQEDEPARQLTATPGQVSVETDPRARGVLAELTAWDVNNRTPLETAQLVSELQRKLKREKVNS